MAKSYQALRARMSPEAQAQAAEKARRRLHPITPWMYRQAKARIPHTLPQGAFHTPEVDIVYERDAAKQIAFAYTLRMVVTYWEPVMQEGRAVGWHCLNPVVSSEYLTWEG